MKKSDLELFMRDRGSKIDLLNIQWIYRAKKYYNMKPADIYLMLIPIHYKLSTELVKDMVEAPGVEEFENVVIRTTYARHYNFKQNLTMEQMYADCLHHLYTADKHVAESIAAHFQAQHRDVDVTGSLACLDNQAVVQRMLAYCVHPNVGAVLIVGHGCEYIEPDRIRDFARAHGRPAEAFYLQKVGGTEAGIALGCRLVGEMLEKIEAGPRAPMYAHELIIGAKCGGSDFTSGIAGNAVIGKFFENLTAAGGTAMMEEIAEAVGLRDHLVSRAVNVDVARDVGLTYDKTMEFCRKLGRYSISPGNFVGGLTTIEEKSMGAVVKMGGCRIEGVLKIAQRPKHPGFWLLDVIPDDKPEPAFFFGGDATGLLDQIACGCHLVLFNTGRGHVGGTPVAPILKLTGNQETFDMLSHDIDFCAGSVLTGAETKAEAAERLWGLIRRICNGEQVHAERVGHRQGTLFFNYQDPRRVVPCRY